MGNQVTQDKIERGYRDCSGIYDDYITSRKLRWKLVFKIVWGNAAEGCEEKLVSLLPDDFAGRWTERKRNGNWAKNTRF
jgi:hypothetical protein